MNFKENLKKLRENKGLSQEELAKQLGTNIETIRRFEQNKSKKIDFEMLEKLTLFFNCSYDDLLK